jgi:hypothetical protein
MMRAAGTVLLLLTLGAGTLVAGDKTSGAPKAIRLADLLALPVEEYRSDPYIQAAQSLQALGKEKTSALLRELAAKEDWPYCRTLSLCRMLFQAKPERTFRRAAVGGVSFPGRTKYEDWPLEPLEIVDGVPFFVARCYILGGEPELPTKYVRYCIEECDWSTLKFTPKSKEEKQKALAKMLLAPRLKGKLDEDERETLEAQIKPEGDGARPGDVDRKR